jgi:type I restriction enzyme S subunit
MTTASVIKQTASYASCLLGDVVDIFDSRRIPLSADVRARRSGPYPYYGANGVVDHIDDYLFEGEHVLLAEDGGYWGRGEACAYLVDGRFWVNNHAHILRAREGVADNAFLVFLLNSLDLNGHISGSTRGKLTQGVLRTIPLSLPILAEQRRIARILSTIQLARTTELNAAAALADVRNGLNRTLFALSTDDVPSELCGHPVRWDECELGEQLALQRGFDITKSEQRDGTVPVVSSSGVQSFHDEAKASAPGVVIGRKGSLGTSYFLTTAFWPHDTTLWVTDFKGNDPKFVYHFFRQFDVRHLDVGASNPTLNRNHLYQMRVRWPDAAGQGAICTILDAVDNASTVRQEVLQALDDVLTAATAELLGSSA